MFALWIHAAFALVPDSIFLLLAFVQFFLQFPFLPLSIILSYLCDVFFGRPATVILLYCYDLQCKYNSTSQNTEPTNSKQKQRRNNSDNVCGMTWRRHHPCTVPSLPVFKKCIVAYKHACLINQSISQRFIALCSTNAGLNSKKQRTKQIQNTHKIQKI